MVCGGLGWFAVFRRCGLKFSFLFHVQSKEKERSFLLGTFKTVLESLTYLASGHVSITHKGISS